METKEVKSKGKKKGGRATVICDSNLTEAQMNEYPKLEVEKKEPKKNKDEYPELKLSLWEKQQLAKHEKEAQMIAK